MATDLVANFACCPSRVKMMTSMFKEKCVTFFFHQLQHSFAATWSSTSVRLAVPARMDVASFLVEWASAKHVL